MRANALKFQGRQRLRVFETLRKWRISPMSGDQVSCRSDCASARAEIKIREGKFVAVGDEVEVVTTDGQQRRFRITELDQSMIKGAEIDIPTGTIIELRVRRSIDGKAAWGAFKATVKVIGAIAYIGGNIAFSAL